MRIISIVFDFISSFKKRKSNDYILTMQKTDEKDGANMGSDTLQQKLSYVMKRRGLSYNIYRDGIASPVNQHGVISKNDLDTVNNAIRNAAMVEIVTDGLSRADVGYVMQALTNTHGKNVRVSEGKKRISKNLSSLSYKITIEKK